MSNVKVSVVMPVYNSEKYLKKSLNSLVKQTLEDIEVICIDDGSADSSNEILQKYAEKYSYITVINNEHGGAGAARNTGLSFAKGEYVSFVDSDDWIEENTCEILYKIAKSKNTDMLIFKMINYDEKEDKLYKTDYYDMVSLKSFDDGEVFNYNDIQDKIFSIATSTANKFYKNSFLKRINAKFYEGFIFEDNPFFFNALLNAERVSILNKYLYYRRRRENSVMSSNNAKFMDIIPIVNYIFDTFKKNGKFKKHEKTLKNFKVNLFRKYYNMIAIEYKNDFFNTIKEDFLYIYKNNNLREDFESDLKDKNLVFYSNALEARSFKEFDLSNKNHDLKEELKKAKKESKRLKKELKHVHSSTSWKVTKPLRKIRKIIKVLK